jgi:hypothetical protein
MGLTAVQKKARDEAMTAAKGKVFTAKLSLTDEQKAKIKEAMTPLEKLH